MNVLSLFDGISCASEIDKYAIQIAQKNYPDTIQVGSVIDLDSSFYKRSELCNSGATNVKYDDGSYHQLTTIECERLQSLPDNYTEGVSNTQRYKVLGNAFNVDVVAHILKYLK